MSGEKIHMKSCELTLRLTHWSMYLRSVRPQLAQSSPSRLWSRSGIDDSDLIEVLLQS